ncbi:MULTISPECIES: MFS transporter [Caballeronia]|jgi:D-galactonate transporter|uniref:Putative tartrate transporter n=1 Tax=Caballeronia zhejiangensis TaxID=871203 RepID=A0A656QNM1_9BURK|nr:MULTISPECIES: MFS transporter [Caballeronia]EKS69886.1 major facilitator superfamily protein [Burkholderia sp. SJ98]KDR32390.1 membrane protein [Caballeronia zhejiangensis]MCG7401294.1 MFS transporter [Caballeronia zhejiangensis]MCI1044584.1 MFS transporter [Caballeronia zhejiangensis]MDR5767480.1 MFS transporter [Caballeronia sp. LZ028]
MDLEARTMKRVMVRLVPFLILCYFIAYLDRVNVGFAALQMNKALGFTASMFGFGAGIFFIAYFFFEVPSNLLLERFGARRWIARIMFTWGILAAAMAYIPHIAQATGLSNAYVFYGLRILLGVAEAGFFPGIIFLLTLWFPAKYRGRVVGYFMAAIPLSTVIGGPISGALLQMDGINGMAGWQWLYLIEAIPALLLAFVVYFYLTDKPSDAHWLAKEERDWLVDRQAQERAHRESVHAFSVKEAIFNPRVLAIALIYFGANATNYGLSFFLPQIVKSFGLSNLQTGFVTSLPYAVGVISMVLWGRHSDRKLERRWHVAIALMVAAGGIAASAGLDDPVMKMIALSIAGFGIFGCLPVIWTLPASFLSGAAAAGGIAAINSLGNLAGFFGPYAMGWIKDSTGGFGAGLLCLAGAGMVGVAAVLLLHHDQALETISGAHDVEDGEPNMAR